MTLNLTRRSVKGTPLSAADHDTNLDKLEDAIEATPPGDREWSAATISQAEAEAGTETTRRAFTAQRVRQAIAAWWTGASTAAGRAIVEAVSAAAQRTLLGLSVEDSPTFTGLTITGTGPVVIPHIHGSIAGNFYVHVRNTSGGTLPAGTAVCVTGSVGATDRLQVVACDPTDPLKMPAVAVLEVALANNGDGDAVILGELRPFNTSGLTLNAALYVGAGGALTATAPTTGIVQAVATVARVNPETGTLVIHIGDKLGTAALRNVGTVAGTVAAGDDGRLNDARTPTAHKATHATGGADALTPADIGAEVSGAAAAAVSAHVAAADPHTQYLTPAEGDAAYAPAAQGVTNGNSHNHDGGDGAQIAYSSLSGLPTLPTGTNTGDQTLSNTSDSTSHTIALSASGGSVQLVEGDNITLTTSGTAGAAVVTVASTGGGTPGGDTTQLQFNDAGAFGGDVDLTWNKTTNVLTVGGDVRLDDAGAFTTTLQVIGQAANQTITQPAATGIALVLSGPSTLAAYAGVDGGYFGALPYSIGGGRLEFSNALGFSPSDGTLSCRAFSTLTVTASTVTASTVTASTIAGNTTYTGRFINNVANAASAPAGLFSGQWFTTGTSTTTKPALLIEQSGAASTGFSPAGTGFGVNSASTFAGRLADLQKNGTSRWHVGSEGLVVTTQLAPAAVDATATLSAANIQEGIITTSTVAAVDMTLPTGTLMDTGIVGIQNNMAIEWSVINTGPNTATLLVGADHTIVGAAAVVAGASGRFVSRRAGTTTWISYRVS